MSSMPHDAVQVLSDLIELRGWQVRRGQVEMVSAIEDTIVDGIHHAQSDGVYDCMVNAPVGTGKSLGEMLPPIVHGMRMVVATSTKRLQDQLVGSELPQLKKDLHDLYGHDLTYAVVKGQSNYPCIAKITKILHDGSFDPRAGALDGEDLFSDDTEEVSHQRLDSRCMDVLQRLQQRWKVAHALGVKADPHLLDAEDLMGELPREVARAIRSPRGCRDGVCARAAFGATYTVAVDSDGKSRETTDTVEVNRSDVVTALRGLATRAESLSEDSTTDRRDRLCGVVATLTDVADTISQAPPEQWLSQLDDVETAVRGARILTRMRACEQWDVIAHRGDVCRETMEFADSHEQGKDVLTVAVDEDTPCWRNMTLDYAAATNVVVMNTSMLIWNSMKSTGVKHPPVVRGRNVVAVDEAHHLTEILSNAYTETLDAGALVKKWSADAKASLRRFKGRPTARALQAAVDAATQLDVDLRALNGSFDMENVDRHVRLEREKAYRASVSNAVKRFLAAHRQACDLAGEHVETDWQALNMSDQWIRDGVSTKDRVGKVISAFTWDVGESVKPFLSSMERTSQQITTSGMLDDVFTNHLSTTDRNGQLVLSCVPVDVSRWRDDMSQAMLGLSRASHDDLDARRDSDGFFDIPALQTFAAEGSGVKVDPLVFSLTSGTLDRGVSAQVGMVDDCYVSVSSPFETERSRVFVPTQLDPKRLGTEKWSEMAVARAVELCRAAGGHTMILSTSLRMVAMFANGLRERFPDWTILEQRNTAEAQMLPQFKASGGEHCVLVGSRSYWEGVDVPGRALSQVIVDKPMMPTLDDPVVNARSEWVERRGGNAFHEVSVTHAKVMMAQGFGRLIRHVDDCGGLVCLDSRVVDTGWGKGVLRLLPEDLLFTRDEATYAAFMKWALSEEAPTTRPPEDARNWAPLRSGRSVHRRRGCIPHR